MATVSESRPQSAELEQRIKNGILQRTGRGVRELKVDLVGDQVVVRGSTTCYYLKQIALQAVLEVTVPAGIPGVESHIQVQASSPNPADGVE
jgi:hypothetical protein